MPDDILSQAAQGNYSLSSPPTLESVQPTPQPAPAYQPFSDLSRTNLSTGEQYQDPEPSKGFGGKLKEALQRFAYYGGQAGLAQAGLPTDFEIQKQKVDQQIRQGELRVQQQNADSLTQQRGLVAVTRPDGTVAMLPPAVAAKVMGQDKVSADKETALGALMQSKGFVKDDASPSGWRPAKPEEMPPPKVTGKTPNKIGLIIAAQNGDQEAQKALNTLHQQDLDLVKARGNSYGQGRLWGLQKALDPETGETNFYTGFDILKAQQNGKQLIPAGSMSQKDIVSVQQLQSEAIPAIKGVEENLSAFDNAKDRAAFARVLKNLGGPTKGQEATWMGNVMDQAIQEGLSPEGQKLAVRERRLAETMGRMRTTLGLPATEQAMSLSLSLIPGPATPSSAFAKDQTKQLREMVQQAVSIPAYGGGKGATPKSDDMETREYQGHTYQRKKGTSAPWVRK